MKRMKRWITAAVIGASLLAPTAGRAADDGITCATCHAEQADELTRSIHGTLACWECHGGEASYALSREAAKAFIQVPGQTSAPFDHGDAFDGKPTRAEVPQRCGGCHADIERMNPFGLRTDQLARYRTSGHGKTLEAKKDDRVAVCIDCHGVHGILPGRDPASRTHPLNVPETCSGCHANAYLMAEFDLPVEVVDEYRQSVHGRLLFEQQDTGAPTCATCHGNHSAIPPGFATVGAVCSRCHEHAAKSFAKSVHAPLSDFMGCVQCHGGGEERHSHLIERITAPPGLMIRRYARILMGHPDPPPEQIAQAIQPQRGRIMADALPGCLDCHEEPEDDESLQKMFTLLDRIGDAERRYVQTGRRLEVLGRGVLLVDSQRFLFEDAKTQLIEVAPVQHSLEMGEAEETLARVTAVCDEVNAQLDELQTGLGWRHRALLPIWIFCLAFALLLYVKYEQLKAIWVKPLPKKASR